jgi:hypothetical protein
VVTIRYDNARTAATLAPVGHDLKTPWPVHKMLTLEIATHPTILAGCSKGSWFQARGATRRQFRLRRGLTCKRLFLAPVGHAFFALLRVENTEYFP